MEWKPIKYVISSFIIATIAQCLLLVEGQLFPDENSDYGVPLHVGKGCCDFGGGMGGVGIMATFSLPNWLVNIFITTLILMPIIILLRGELRSGVITVIISIIGLYWIVETSRLLYGMPNQGLMLDLTIVALVLVFGVQWWRRELANRKNP